MNKRQQRQVQKEFPLEVDIYQCGGIRVDGSWYGPSSVRHAAEEYAAICCDLGKPMVFKKQEDTSDKTALRVTTIFQQALERRRGNG